MHLHHELQRALADAKIDQTSPTPHLPAPPENRPHREQAAASTRSVRPARSLTHRVIAFLER